MTDAVNGILPSWVEGGGPEGDIVLASKGVLTRNLADFPFPEKCSEYERRAVQERVSRALGFQDNFSAGAYTDLDAQDPMVGLQLVESELTDQDLVRSLGPRGVYVGADAGTSVSVNGADHLTMRKLLPGLQADEVWATLNKLDNELSASLDFAFQEDLGYLTASIDSVGTGLHVTLYMHLPGVAMAKQVLDLENELNRNDIALTPFCGTLNDAPGDLFCLSNGSTLGRSEDELVFNLKIAAHDTIRREREIRDEFLREAQVTLEDRVGRAVGIARGAHLLDFAEGLDLLSAIRMGIGQSLLEGIDEKLLNELLVESRPAHLRLRTGHNGDELSQSVARADLFRARFS